MLCNIVFLGQKVKGQGHNALITGKIRYGNMNPAHNCFSLTPFIMRLHIQTPHESRMCPIYFWVKRSRSQCIDYRKQSMSHNCFPIIMKLNTQTPHELRVCPIVVHVIRSKFKVTMHWLLKMEHNCFSFTPIIMKLNTDSPWVEGVPYCCSCHKVKGQGHIALMTENGA